MNVSSSSYLLVAYSLFSSSADKKAFREMEGYEAEKTTSTTGSLEVQKRRGDIHSHTHTHTHTNYYH